MDKGVDIITDLEGRKIVLINDIRFKGKTKEEWDKIEKYLKQYIGSCFEIEGTSEKIYIARDFPDEFSHGKDKINLSGKNIKAKANASQGIEELIKIATNKSYAPDYAEKHKRKARHGWYRYDTRLALPIYNIDGEVERYNVYKMRMLVRHCEDGKVYLYDFFQKKKAHVLVGITTTPTLLTEPLLTEPKRKRNEQPAAVKLHGRKTHFFLVRH